LQKKILLVEDDIILGETLKELLDDEGFDTTWTKDSQEAINETYEMRYDIYLFDIDLPYMNGIELLRELRASDDLTPCLFLTAKVDIESLNSAFEAGADDYIKKPFDFEEVLIRINSQIKKAFKSYDDIIKYNDLTYNISSRAIYQDNSLISLSPMELRLFEIFIKNINSSISIEDILFLLHDGEEGSNSALRVYISKLKKLGLNITNQRGVGYKLIPVKNENHNQL
jgi:DNA-binding response OmpR family regulator